MCRPKEVDYIDNNIKEMKIKRIEKLFLVIYDYNQMNLLIQSLITSCSSCSIKVSTSVITGKSNMANIKLSIYFTIYCIFGNGA